MLGVIFPKMSDFLMFSFWYIFKTLKFLNFPKSVYVSSQEYWLVLRMSESHSEIIDIEASRSIQPSHGSKSEEAQLYK